MRAILWLLERLYGAPDSLKRREVKQMIETLNAVADDLESKAASLSSQASTLRGLADEIKADSAKLASDFSDGLTPPPTSATTQAVPVQDAPPAPTVLPPAAGVETPQEVQPATDTNVAPSDLPLPSELPAPQETAAVVDETLPA